MALALSVLAGQAGADRDLDTLRERADTLDDARNRIVDSTFPRHGNTAFNAVNTNGPVWCGRAWDIEYHHGFNDSIQKFSNIVLHVTGP